MSLAIDKCGQHHVIHKPDGFYGTPRNAYWLFLLCMTLTLTLSKAQKSVPELWGQHVHDEANILTQPVVDRLEQQLTSYQDSTSNEVAILIIQSLEGDALEDYSMRVVEQLQLGKKTKDNGVLLLIVVDEHKMRIEVGYGLEGVLTDAQSSRIIRNELAPHFRKNQYDEGVTEGINAIIKTIGGEYKADDEGDTDALSLKERVLIGLFIFVILGIFTFMGLVIPGCGGWFLYAFLIPFYAVFPMIVLGMTAGFSLLAIYVVGFPILKFLLAKTAWGKGMAKKMATASAGGRGWSTGSGWSSGGGRSSGGFSGGGGSFGGGGSSGSW